MVAERCPDSHLETVEEVRMRYVKPKKLGIVDRENREGVKIRRDYWRCARIQIISKAISAEGLKKAGFFNFSITISLFVYKPEWRLIPKGKYGAV